MQGQYTPPPPNGKYFISQSYKVTLIATSSGLTLGVSFRQKHTFARSYITRLSTTTDHFDSRPRRYRSVCWLSDSLGQHTACKHRWRITVSTISSILQLVMARFSGIVATHASNWADWYVCLTSSRLWRLSIAQSSALAGLKRFGDIVVITVSSFKHHCAPSF